MAHRFRDDSNTVLQSPAEQHLPRLAPSARAASCISNTSNRFSLVSAGQNAPAMGSKRTVRPVRSAIVQTAGEERSEPQPRDEYAWCGQSGDSSPARGKQPHTQWSRHTREAIVASVAPPLACSQMPCAVQKSRS
jgi:hypothetical protein